MSKINKKPYKFLTNKSTRTLDGSISDMAYIVFNILDRKEKSYTHSIKKSR